MFKSFDKAYMILYYLISSLHCTFFMHEDALENWHFVFPSLVFIQKNYLIVVCEMSNEFYILHPCLTIKMWMGNEKI